MQLSYVPEALARLDAWLAETVALLPEPKPVQIDGADFEWRFPNEGHQELVVCKAVRMASSLSAAWELAQQGYITEACSLLRLTADFASEINFIGEAVIEERSTTSQEEFRRQFFERLPRSMDAYLARERAYYVSRKEISKAEKKLAKKAGVDAELLESTSAFLSFGLNAYVHGAYETAMELYHGGRKRFMTKGMEQRRENGMRFVGLKTTEALHAMVMVGIVFKKSEMVDEIRDFLDEADPQVNVV